MTDPDENWDIPRPGSLVEVLKTYAGTDWKGKPLPTRLKFKEQAQRGLTRIDHLLLARDGLTITDFIGTAAVPEKYYIPANVTTLWLNRQDARPADYPRHWTEYGPDFQPGDVGMVLKVRRNHMWVQFPRGQGWVDKNVLRIIPPWDDDEDDE